MNTISRLRAVPFLSHLRPVQLQALAEIFTREDFIAGEDIIHQGDLTSHFFIIDEGYVHFRKTDAEGFEKPAGTKGPGEFFGIKMFTSEEPSEYTVEALGKATLYAIARAAFDELIQQRPDILRFMPEVNEQQRKLTMGFSWLTPGETIAVTTHRHIATLFITLLPPLLVGLVAAGVLFGLNAFGIVSGTPLMVIGVVALIIVVGWGIWSGGDWADDDFIVTNKRVVRADRALGLRETRDEIPISKIQSMTVVKHGVVSAFIDMGSLEIHSAGKDANSLVFDRIARAEDLKKDISKQVMLLRAFEQAKERERFRRHVGKELRHYVLKEPLPQATEPTAPTITKPKTDWVKKLKDWWKSWFGDELRRGETITWRKHWIALFGQIRLWLLLVAAALLVAAIYAFIPLARALPGTAFFAVGSVLFLAGFAGLAYQWEDWRNDIYQINEREIIDVERRPFGLNERSTVALLANVQDVRAKRPNVLHAVLNYGNVEVQVAGGDPLIFYDVARPQMIVEEIFRRLEVFRVKKMERETSIQSRQIVDALVAYHRLLIAEKHDAASSETTVSPTTDAANVVDASAREVASLPAAVPQLPSGATASQNQIPTNGKARRDEELAEFPPAEEFDDHESRASFNNGAEL